MKLEFMHTTASSGNKYPLELYYKTIKPSEIILLEGNKADYCKGCKNDGKNGGCSWCAPDFMKLATKYKWFQIISIKSDYETISKNPKMSLYHKVLAMERLTSNIINRISINFLNLAKTKGKSYLIACGNCRSCKRNGCSVSTTGKCSQPLKRRYSMEATGINVEATLKEYLGVQLLWYKKGSGILPEYITRACGILTNMSKKDCDKTLFKAMEESGYDVR